MGVGASYVHSYTLDARSPHGVWTTTFEAKQ